MINTVKFPGLNGIRFFAAALVIAGHTETCKSQLGFERALSHDYEAFLGSFGVNVFFVLSGFLITYLLLRERENGSINIRNFYVRRVLRIWPLYFLIIGLAFFIMPHIPFMYPAECTGDMSNNTPRLLLYMGLMANVALDYFPLVAFANVLWSVAAEEQFYLIWPHILKKCRNILRPLIITAVILWLFKVLLHLTSPDTPLMHLVDRTRFTSFIMGGIGAWLVYHQSAHLKFVYQLRTQLISLGLFAVLFLDLIHVPFFGAVRLEFSAIVTCVLIMNIAANPRSVVRLEHPVLNYLGQISYGLYVFHMFSVIFYVRLFRNIWGTTEPGAIASTGLLLAVFLTTIFISHLSYRYFETPFLHKKLRFSTIISGDLAGNTAPVKS